MTPAAYVYGILADNIDSIPGLKSDDIFTFDVDDSAGSDVIVLITEEPGMGDDYGNDNILYANKRIQIDFYYPKDYEEDMNALEQSLKKVLRDNGLYCYSDAGHVLSLDSRNITNTLKFNIKMEV